MVFARDFNFIDLSKAKSYAVRHNNLDVLRGILVPGEDRAATGIGTELKVD